MRRALRKSIMIPENTALTKNEDGITKGEHYELDIPLGKGEHATLIISESGIRAITEKKPSVTIF